MGVRSATQAAGAWRAYLIAVTATEFILAAWQLTRLHPVPDQLGLFAVVLGCGMVCVEATWLRRGASTGNP